MADNYRRVFTIEVDGRPVATFEVGAVGEAQSLLKETWLRDDLASLKSGGVPLLAPNAKISVRPATVDEIVIFGRGARTAKPSDDDVLLIYLVQLAGPR
jgi:hypothetical protein